MLSKTLLSMVALLFLSIVISGCGDEDYKSGKYWLNKEKNWQMAAKAFRRSLDKNPKSWKVHLALIEALGNGDDDLAMETQLRNMLSHFPDSARSRTLAEPAIKVLTHERYNRIAASIEQYHLANQLATQKGDKPTLLSRGIMAASRSKDSSAVIDYYDRLLTSLDGSSIPDSVRQEMHFFIGPARMSWLRQDWNIRHKNDNIESRLSQLDAGMFLGDAVLLTQKVKELVSTHPDAAKSSDIARRFGLLVDADPFNTREIVQGSDASYAPSGKQIVYVKDMAISGSADPYIYRCSASGTDNTPLLKAVQYQLASIAMPVYSPDQKWLYFFGSSERNWNPDVEGRFYLYRVKPSFGSRPQKLTDARLIATAPYFEDSNSLLLIRRESGSLSSSVEVVRFNPDTKAMNSVGRISEPVIGATLSPDGDSLLFSTDRGIFKRAVKGGEISVDLNWQDIVSPRVSPNGEWLILLGKSSQLIAVNRESGKLYWLGKVHGRSFTFLSDSRLLVTRTVKDKPYVYSLSLDGKVDINKFAQMVTK